MFISVNLMLHILDGTTYSYLCSFQSTEAWMYGHNATFISLNNHKFKRCFKLNLWMEGEKSSSSSGHKMRQINYLWWLLKHRAVKMYWGMEVSGQLHALAALPLRKDPLVPLDRRLNEPQSSSGRGGEEKNSQPSPVIEP